MKLFAVAALLIASVSAKTTWMDLHEANYVYTLHDLEAEFGVKIAEEELAMRAEVLRKNLLKIKQHNAGPSSYKMGVNQFAHLTSAEFKNKIRGTKASGTDQTIYSSADLSGHVATTDLPKELDWREKGVVTPAKNQGGCGSCWAFSATETIESAVAIATGKLLKLAPQQLVSCSPNPQHCGGTGGCQGSTQWLGFNYTIHAGGMTTEADYPYRGSDSKCATEKIKPAVKISGYVRLPANNYSALMNAVTDVGPIAISAAAEPWQLYEEGIYDGDCGADVDHAIQLVGYGQGKKGIFSKKEADYWLVRNSWGTMWGEKGYIRIERFGDTPKGETCYTDRTPSDGTACAGGPKTEKVCGLCGIMSDSSYVTGASLV